MAVCCVTAGGVSCAAGEGFCSGAGVVVGVAAKGVRSAVGVAVCSGVGVAVCSRVGVGARSAVGVAAAAGVGARAAFLRGLWRSCGGRFTGFLPPLRTVAFDLLPTPLLEVTAPFIFPRTILPETRLTTTASLLVSGMREPTMIGVFASYQVSVPEPVAYPFLSRLPDHVANSPGLGEPFQTSVPSLVR